MNKEGNTSEFFGHLQSFWKSFKQSYLYRLVSKTLSAICTVILVILLVIGGLMFFFNMQGKAAQNKGMTYTPPFGLYTIISPSMEPNVEVYDVIIAIDQDISKIKVGDIITFISNWDVNYGLTVTHRVVEISKNESGEYQLTTKGDNNSTSDGGSVTQSNLVGKVVGRIPQLGQLQFFLATKMGWFMVVFIPAIIVIILDMIKIFKLYVLKEEINSVKTPKEAKKEEVNKLLDEKNTELKEINKEKITRHKDERAIDDENAFILEEKKIDETVDTVELPKIDIDGKWSTGKIATVKEETDLPKIKRRNKAKVGNDVNEMQPHQLPRRKINRK